MAASVSSYAFGSGNLYLTPFGAAAAANPTPTRIGVLQDVSVDFNGNIKELFGQGQFAVAVRRGQVKIQCKAKFAQFLAKPINDTFFGAAITATQELIADSEFHAAGTTVTVTHATNPIVDYGVVDAVTGVPLALVPTGPAAGQYSVVLSTGVYTLGTTTDAVQISYGYPTTAGQAFTVANTNIGATPQFTATFNAYDLAAGTQITVALLACVASKFTLATKIEDFMVPEFDFSAFANNAGNVFSIWSSN